MPLTLGELSSIISQPRPPAPVDPSVLFDVNAQRQKLGMQAQGMADEREKAGQAAQLTRLGQIGSMERAKMRDQMNRDRLAQEDLHFKAKNEGERSALKERAYQALHDAQDRGDAQGVTYAKQALERLGEVVEESGTGTLPPEQQTAPPGSPMAESPLARGAFGVPRPRAARTGGVPGQPMAPAQQLEPLYFGPDGEFADQSPRPTGQAPDWLRSEMRLRGQLAPPTNAPPEPRYFGPDGEFSGSPPAAPVRQPMPEVPIDPNYAAAEPPQAAPAAPQGKAPPTLGGLGGLRVLRDGKQMLTLGQGGGAVGQIEKDFAPLVAAARTPEEKRRAQLALDTARSIVEREGIEKAREAGMKVYAGEQANDRKTRVGTGRGVGETSYGGTGLTKAGYAVNQDYREQYNKIVGDIYGQYGIKTETMKADMALRKVLAAASAGSGTSDLAATLSALKAMGNSGATTDRDLDRIFGSSGVWATFKNYINRAMTGELPPELMANIKGMAQQLSAAIAAQKEAAGSAAYEAVLNDPFLGNAPDVEQMANAAGGRFAGYSSQEKRDSGPTAPQQKARPVQQVPAAGGDRKSKWGY